MGDKGFIRTNGDKQMASTRFMDSPVYVVRTRDMKFSTRVRAKSENQALSKVMRKHGLADYLVYLF